MVDEEEEEEEEETRVVGESFPHFQKCKHEEEEEEEEEDMERNDYENNNNNNKTTTIQSLPEGALAHIFSLLPAISVVHCMLTSKQFNRAALSDGTCWKRQCKKLANVKNLDELRKRARRDVFMNSEKVEKNAKNLGQYYRKVFIEMQKNPLMRYRFLKTIPTLGLNVQELKSNSDRRKKMVFGGFSFNAVERDEEEYDDDDESESEEEEEEEEMKDATMEDVADDDGKENVSKNCSIENKKRTSDGALKNMQLSRERNAEEDVIDPNIRKTRKRKKKKKPISDYASFNVRERVEVRDSHRQRMWECLDVCSGTLKAVKLVGFLEKPEEGLRSRKLREAANMKALSTEIAVRETTTTTGAEDPFGEREYVNGANSIARLERLVTIDEEMPFEVPWLVGELPPELQAAEEEDEQLANSVGKRRILPRLSGKMLMIHEHFPISLRAQRSRVCDNPVVADKQPPKEWCYDDDGTFRLKRSKVRMLTQQLIEGVRFAHSRGIAHRNLHCGHLLVDAQKNDGNGQLVIASWAASRGCRDIGKRSPLRSCTVPYYIAPEGLIIPPVHEIDLDSMDETAYDDIETFDGENDGDDDDNDDEGEKKKEVDDEEGDGKTKILKKEKKKPVLPKQYTNAVDVWACGCVFAEFLLGSSLFNKFAYYEGAEQLDQILCIFKLLGTPNETLWPDVKNIPGWHEDMFPMWLPRVSFLKLTGAKEITVFQADLLRRMLTLDPSRRITAHEALQHPYFSSETEFKDDRVVKYEDEDAQRLKLPGGETIVQRHVRLVTGKEDKEEELFGIVSKLEESPCQKYHRYHVVFDVKQAPLSMSSFVSLETKLEVVKNDKEETVVRVKFCLATQYWSESDVLLKMVL